MDKFKSTLSFEHFLVTDIVFKLNYKYNADSLDATPISCRFDISHHNVEQDPNRIMVSINTKLFNEEFTETDNPFYLSVTLNGYFKLDKPFEGNSGDSEKLLKTNTVAILFPYVRSIITNITSQANIPPVILPPVNTFKLMEESQNKERAQETPQ